MKTTTVRRSYQKSLPRIPYPNAATREEVIHKILDLLITCVVGAGLSAGLLLITAML